MPATNRDVAIAFVYVMTADAGDRIAHLEQTYDEALSRRQLGWPDTQAHGGVSRRPARVVGVFVVAVFPYVAEYVPRLDGIGADRRRFVFSKSAKSRR